MLSLGKLPTVTPLLKMRPHELKILKKSFLERLKLRLNSNRYIPSIPQSSKPPMKEESKGEETEGEKTPLSLPWNAKSTP